MKMSLVTFGNDLKGRLKALPAPVLSVMRYVTIVPLRFFIRYFPWRPGKLLAYNLVAEHLWWLESHVDARTVFGDTLRVDASDIVGKHLYYFGVWEPSLTHWIGRRLRKDDLFVDVGANIGYYTLLAAHLVGPGGRVVAVEALPQTFDRLQANIQANGIHNTRAINRAAWSKSESLTIFVRAEGPSGASTLMSEWATQWSLKKQIVVQAEPLSVLLTSEELRTARLMKIDVEGAEWQVITDMVRWLPQTAHNFEIIIEVSNAMMSQQGQRFEDLVDLFASAGFNTYRIPNDYRASSCIQWKQPVIARRIHSWPEEAVDQIDVILSRVDAETL